MDTTEVAVVAYDHGEVVLTRSHLLFLHPDSRVEFSFALEHLSDAASELAHSFRHRLLGLIVGFALLLFGLIALAGFFLANMLNNLAVAPRTIGRFGIAGGFCLGFGVIFLYGALSSRQVYWLRFCYAGVRRQLPLPGVSTEALDRLVELLQEARP